MTEPELTFQGVPIVWDEWDVPYIPPRRRIGRLRLVSGLEALVLHLPRKAFRGCYVVNMDAGYVDCRRLKRAHRRLRRARDLLVR